jgi:hypothetical protein
MCLLISVKTFALRSNVTEPSVTEIHNMIYMSAPPPLQYQRPRSTSFELSPTVAMLTMA